MDASSRVRPKSTVQSRGRSAAGVSNPSASRMAVALNSRTSATSTTRMAPATTVRNSSTSNVIREIPMPASRALPVRAPGIASRTSRVGVRLASSVANNRGRAAPVQNSMTMTPQANSTQEAMMRHRPRTPGRVRQPYTLNPTVPSIITPNVVESPYVSRPKVASRVPTRKSDRLRALTKSPNFLDCSFISSENLFHCPICFENVKKVGRSIVATKCGHVFCRNCLRSAFSKSRDCPICQQKYLLVDAIEIYL